MAAITKFIESQWFDAIINGSKKYEGRPNYGFWRNLKVGDYFFFIRQPEPGTSKIYPGNPAEPGKPGKSPVSPVNQMEVQVTSLKYYPHDFRQACVDFGNSLMPNCSLEKAIAIYEDLEERYDWSLLMEKYGVVIIGIQILPL